MSSALPLPHHATQPRSSSRILLIVQVAEAHRLCEWSNQAVFIDCGPRKFSYAYKLSSIDFMHCATEQLYCVKTLVTAVFFC